MKPLTDPNKFTTKEEWENWVNSEEFRDSLKTELANYRDKGVVYSGPDYPQREDFNNLRGLNRVQGEEWAKENKGITLETTQAGKLIENANLKERFGKEVQDKIMDKASIVYAESLSGDVRAHIQGANKQDVFFKREFPALLDNKEVTSINGLPKEQIRESIQKDASLEEAHKLINKGLENAATKNETQIYQRSGEQWNQYENLTQKAEQKNEAQDAQRVRSEAENTKYKGEARRDEQPRDIAQERISFSAQQVRQEVNQEPVKTDARDIAQEKISFARAVEAKQDIAQEPISFKKQEQTTAQQETAAPLRDREIHRDAGNLGEKWDRAEAERIYRQGMTPGERYDLNEKERVQSQEPQQEQGQQRTRSR